MDKTLAAALGAALAVLGAGNLPRWASSLIAVGGFVMLVAIAVPEWRESSRMRRKRIKRRDVSRLLQVQSDTMHGLLYGLEHARNTNTLDETVWRAVREETIEVRKQTAHILRRELPDSGAEHDFVAIEGNPDLVPPDYDFDWLRRMREAVHRTQAILEVYVERAVP